MKSLKFYLSCTLIFILIILVIPLSHILKTDAAGRLNLAGFVDKSSYTVGAQIVATFTASFTGSSPSSSQRFKFTGKLITQTVANNTEWTILDQTYVGNSTWPISGTYYFTAPPTSQGTYYIQFKAYDMNLNQMIELANSSVLPASTSVPLPNPVVTVWANGVNPSLTVISGAAVQITWDTTNNPTSCTYLGSPVPVYGHPGFTVYPTTTKTYTITCSN